MEMEFFCPPDEAIKWYEFWRAERMKWWESLGVKPSNLRFRDHAQDELAFYSKATVDIEYLYPFTAPDFGELEGIAHRGDYDLSQHSKHSGTKLDYFDQDLQLRLKAEGASPEEVKSRSRYIPNVIEPASGLTRAVLVLLCESYRKEPGRQGTEEMFSFKPQFASDQARNLPAGEQRRHARGGRETVHAASTEVHLRVRREAGGSASATPAWTRSARRSASPSTARPRKDQAVTVRERDSMKQERVALDQVEAYVAQQLSASPL